MVEAKRKMKKTNISSLSQEFSADLPTVLLLNKYSVTVTATVTVTVTVTGSSEGSSSERQVVS
jgi:hypothetical protein